jgi:hypothetical protein
MGKSRLRAGDGSQNPSLNAKAREFFAETRMDGEHIPPRSRAGEHRNGGQPAILFLSLDHQRIGGGGLGRERTRWILEKLRNGSEPACGCTHGQRPRLPSARVQHVVSPRFTPNEPTKHPKLTGEPPEACHWGGYG